jgi:carboxypeptidase C (cathepsin A)
MVEQGVAENAMVGVWLVVQSLLARLQIGHIHFLLVAFIALAATITTDASGAQVGGPEPDKRFVIHPESASYRLHSIELDGEPLSYVSTAGTLTLFDETSFKPTASVFFVSYRKYDSLRDETRIGALAEEHLSEEQRKKLQRTAEMDGVSVAVASTVEHLLAAGVPMDELMSLPDASERPLSFSFNGGPGSSSVWLHLGIFGPKRISYGDAFGNPGPPPYKLVENEATLLGASDWVFIDPVSTGFSRTEGETPGSTFHGVEQDIGSVGEFIRRFLTSEQRWGSPKFIAGESYGTTRAAGLADHLHNRHGINLNGVILISSVLDFGSIRFNIGHDLPYILFLPTYAATAHHHGMLSDELQALSVEDVLEQAEAFAIGEYASALMHGTALPAERFEKVADRMAELTGLSPEYVRQSRLRVSQPRFGKELLREQGLTVGRFDSRFTGRDRDDAGEGYDYDASYAAIRSIYTQTLNEYLRSELGYTSDLSYEILTGRVQPWDFGNAGNNRFVNTADRLRSVMQQQPYMKVFIGSGIYDLATPHFANEYVINHMMLREDVLGNIRFEDYGAGHMMYLREQDLIQLGDDLREWYAEVLKKE